MQRLPIGPLYYEFSREREPRLRIAPGETIVVETEDALSGQIRVDSDRRDRLKMPYSNPLTGPILVEGAMPGDVLAVRIDEIRPTIGQCATKTDPGPLVEWLGADCPHGTHVCPIVDGLIHWSDSVAIPYAPMLGCIGTAPASGSPTTLPAGPHGGNMDIIETCPGNTVYLPVSCPGALLYLGDAHAAMGHGELSATGLEMPAESTITVTLIRRSPPGVASDRVAGGDHGGRQRRPDGAVGRPSVRRADPLDGGGARLESLASVRPAHPCRPDLGRLSWDRHRGRQGGQALPAGALSGPFRITMRTLMIHRRQFLARSAALMLAPGLARADAPRKKVAFLGTEVRTLSHAQHFLDRMTLGYNWAGRWVPPRVEVASIYVDQVPEGDLSKGRIARHGLKQFPTIEEALTLGGSTLAVDGVVIIAEHGRYPKNEMGQTLYPRYEFFKRVVKVFERSGRSRSGLQRQAPLDHLGPLPRDGGRLETPGVPVPGRLVAAGHLAAPADRHAARHAAGRERLRGLRRGRQLRLPRPRDGPVHVRASRRGRAGDPPGPRLEGLGALAGP